LFPVSWLPALFSGSGPLNYDLFPGLKKIHLEGRHFSCDTQVISAAETWLDGQFSDYFLVACES
jgi:hypothetical protein